LSIDALAGNVRILQQMLPMFSDALETEQLGGATSLFLRNLQQFGEALENTSKSGANDSAKGEFE
jgi:hypothetical protein